MQSYVIYFGRFELPDKNALAHRVMANAVALTYAGYKVILVGYTKGLDKNIYFHKINTGSIEFYEFPYPKTVWEWILDGKIYKRVIKIAKNIGIKNCKAVILNNIGISANVLLKFSKKYRVPLIHDCVDWFLYNERSLHDFYKNFQSNYTRKYLDPKIKNIICISRYLFDFYKNNGCNVLRIPSLTYSNDSRFLNLPEYKPSKGVVICYTGNPGFKASKDRIDWCVKAFTMFAGNCDKLVVIGISEERFKDDFEDIYNNIGDKNVSFITNMKNRECIEITAKSDFLMFARKDYITTRAGFPTKFSESMAIGTPVITTPSGDLPMYIENGKNGFISSECTYESFEKIVKRAIETTYEERIAMHEKCKDSPLDEKYWRKELIDFVENLSNV